MLPSVSRRSPATGLCAAPGEPPTLTVVRGAAGEELGSGATAFFCQINGHLYVLNPLFHLSPGTEGEMGVSFAEHSREEGEQVRSPSYLAATMTACRWPRRVRQWGTPHSSSLFSICGASVHNVTAKEQARHFQMFTKIAMAQGNKFMAMPMNFPLSNH